MPTAFQVFALDSFPDGDDIRTEEQLVLFADEDENVETTVTKLAKSADQPHPDLTRFEAEHDFLFRLQYPGRARGKYFREFITPYKFSVFRGNTSALGFQPLVVRTKKRVAADFVKRLNQHADGFRARGVILDFVTLRPRLELIRGAWFGAMRQPNLATTGVFGHHVDLSEEFQHAEGVGELKTLLIEFGYDGVNYIMMTGAEGGIVLYDAFQTEADELKVVYAALTGILIGCLSPKPDERRGHRVESGDEQD